MEEYTQQNGYCATRKLLKHCASLLSALVTMLTSESPRFSRSPFYLSTGSSTSSMVWLIAFKLGERHVAMTLYEPPRVDLTALFERGLLHWT